MNYAIVDKNTNRLIAIVDNLFKGFFIDKFPLFNVVEISSIGSSTFTTEKGNIDTISVQPKGTYFSNDCYHMITSFPVDEMSDINEAYELINR